MTYENIIKMNKEKKGVIYMLEKYYSTDVDGKELPKDIDFTMLVSADSRKKVGSTIGRAAVGAALLGPIGLLAGATGKSKRTTTFIVRTKDGNTKNVIVYTDSLAFEELCKYMR